MIDTAHSDSADTPDLEAEKFSEVASGIYRRFCAESVWLALRYAVREKLFADNPTIMLMFVRIAEVYPEAAALLKDKLDAIEGPLRQALELVLNPPVEIRDAKYLPESIESPGEMDLCWAEFLVTGKPDSVETVLSVLDRPDRTRAFLATHFAASANSELYSSEHLMLLQQIGIGLGKPTGEGSWEVMTPGDTDLFLWLGVKDENLACTAWWHEMDDGLRLHIACKGAALWSLQANAAQHGIVRLLCDNAAEQAGGFGRKLLATPMDS